MMSYMLLDIYRFFIGTISINYRYIFFRALEDIEDSIAELKYYKKTFLIPRTDI